MLTNVFEHFVVLPIQSGIAEIRSEVDPCKKINGCIGILITGMKFIAEHGLEPEQIATIARLSLEVETILLHE